MLFGMMGVLVALDMDGHNSQEPEICNELMDLNINGLVIADSIVG